MCIPYFIFRNAQCIPKVEIVQFPAGDVSIVKLLEWFGGPGSCMNPVRDGIYMIACVHQPGYLAMFFCNPIDIMTEIKREIGHVQHFVLIGDVTNIRIFSWYPENSSNQLRTERVGQIH